MFSNRRAEATTSPPPGKGQTAEKVHNPQANRETVESIVVAVILAFLFRGYVAEAFVIPTGSMAPTLVGNHKDVNCPQCNYQYQANASVENDDGDGRRGDVVATTCPICRFTMEVDSSDPRHWSFSGDRILVSKFTYNLSEPKRWDVIVFKYPGNAKQNYIKRLVGLPGEKIRIERGDVYIQGKDDADFVIARKPDHRLRSLLQLVDDTRFIAPELRKAGWPSRWQSTAINATADDWKESDDGHEFSVAGKSSDEKWLRYRHLVPTYEDWKDVLEGNLPTDLKERPGFLITDYYAYNAYDADPPNRDSLLASTLGAHWVGDIALDAEVEVKGESGELLLDLVEGGVHFTCRIDVASGGATVEIDGGKQAFRDASGATHPRVTATTSLRGAGTYEVRLANVDNEIRLWIDDRAVTFDHPGTYEPASTPIPQWSADNSGDLAPAGIGSHGVPLIAKRLRILRDVYYTAAEPGVAYDYEGFRELDMERILTDPSQWAVSGFFESRRRIEFTLGPDDFFPMGDNSPQSKDARIWNDNDFVLNIPSAVDRSLLTGEALVIYWPHAWYTPLRIYIPRFNRPGQKWQPIPLTPNVRRMGLIR